MFDSSEGRDTDLLYTSEQVKERDFFRWQKRASERAGREITTAEFSAMSHEERREAAGVASATGGGPA